MKRFVFRLETLLDIRKRSEEQIKLRLAKKNRKIIEKQKILEGCYQELKELQSSEKARRSGGEPVVLLRYSVAFRHKLKGDILEAGRCIDDLRASVAAIRNELVEATKARRALEIIRERQLLAWKKSYNREEQNFIDDVAQQKYIRAQR